VSAGGVELDDRVQAVCIDENRIASELLATHRMSSAGD
jgi:hypothetical protein